MRYLVKDRQQLTRLLPEIVLVGGDRWCSVLCAGQTWAVAPSAAEAVEAARMRAHDISFFAFDYNDRIEAHNVLLALMLRLELREVSRG